MASALRRRTGAAGRTRRSADSGYHQAVTLLSGVRGALVDVDGTLLVADRPVPGAAAALDVLRRRGIALRLTTNTTRRSRASVAAVLRGAGFAVEDDDVLAPSILARQRVLTSDHPTALLLVSEDARRDFAGVEEDPEAPGFVVLGDLGAGFTFDILNAAFRALRAGARLLALHRGPYWTSPAGDVLDAGAFVAALEYGAATRAECVGKPEPAFFDLALEVIGLPPNDVIVVGDDLENDAAAGAAAGCRTVLVLTGKATRGVGAGAADCILDSVAELPGVLGTTGPDLGGA